MSCNLIQMVLGAVLAATPGNQPTLSQIMTLAHFDHDTNSSVSGNVADYGSLNMYTGQYSILKKQFGTAAMYCGNASYGAVGLTSQNYIGINDFTLEMFVNRVAPSASTSSGIFGGGTGKTGLGVYVTGSGSVVVGSRTTNFITTGAGAFAFDAWNHVALTRQGTRLCLWINGNLAGSATVSNWSIETPSLYVAYGQDTIGNGYYLGNGFIDEFRFCKGIAVYTDNFTPPTQAFDIPTA